MTASEMIQLVTALGGLATIIGGVVVLIIKTWKDEITTKVDVIKASVDGTASRQEAALKAAVDKLEFVSGLLIKEEQKAAVLAAGAIKPATGPVTEPRAGNTREGDAIKDTKSIAKTLGNIEDHTAATAQNTAKAEEHK